MLTSQPADRTQLYVLKYTAAPEALCFWRGGCFHSVTVQSNSQLLIVWRTLIHRRENIWSARYPVPPLRVELPRRLRSEFLSPSLCARTTFGCRLHPVCIRPHRAKRRQT